MTLNIVKKMGAFLEKVILTTQSSIKFIFLPEKEKSSTIKRRDRDIPLETTHLAVYKSSTINRDTSY